MDDLNTLATFIGANAGRSMNEADTRHQIIDVVLHGILKWPRSRTATEEYIAPGYADYVLKKQMAKIYCWLKQKKRESTSNCLKLIIQQKTHHIFPSQSLSQIRRLKLR